MATTEVQTNYVHSQNFSFVATITILKQWYNQWSYDKNCLKVVDITVAVAVAVAVAVVSVFCCRITYYTLGLDFYL